MQEIRTVTTEGGQRERNEQVGQGKSRSRVASILAAIIQDSRRGALPYVEQYDVKRGAE